MPPVPPSPARPAPLWALALTVVVFGGVVAGIAWQMREGLHAQILRREADSLAAVATLQLDTRAAEYGEVTLGEVPGALLVAVLQAARYRGVSAVRVLDAAGAVNAADGIAGELPPPTGAEWRRLQSGEAFARLRPAPGEDILLVPAEGAEPLLEAWVPLQRSGSRAVLGAAQFWMEASRVHRELGEHDARLRLQALAGWAVGSLVILAVLGWAFRRLETVNAELRARSSDLERANRELVLAAKTSALGTVTAHLIHELKHPIAGLELLVSGQGEGAGDEPGRELAEASALTRRLRTMVNDVVAVLRDEQGDAAFHLTAAEVAEVAAAKVREEAARRGVRIETAGDPAVELAGRRSNLAVLVLRNLLQNALEAQPGGGWIRLQAGRAPEGGVEFSVADGGPGLPAAVRARLFQPCASGKPGGSGLGLALSHQLAQRAGGDLALAHSDASGTRFRLVLTGEA